MVLGNRPLIVASYLTDQYPSATLQRANMWRGSPHGRRGKLLVEPTWRLCRIGPFLVAVLLDIAKGRSSAARERPRFSFRFSRIA